MPAHVDVLLDARADVLSSANEPDTPIFVSARTHLVEVFIILILTTLSYDKNVLLSYVCLLCGNTMTVIIRAAMEAGPGPHVLVIISCAASDTSAGGITCSGGAPCSLCAVAPQRQSVQVLLMQGRPRSPCRCQAPAAIMLADARTPAVLRAPRACVAVDHEWMFDSRNNRARQKA
jgi:hypothetical protein